MSVGTCGVINTAVRTYTTVSCIVFFFFFSRQLPETMISTALALGFGDWCVYVRENRVGNLSNIIVCLALLLLLLPFFLNY